jgi:hypothetical protein
MTVHSAIYDLLSRGSWYTTSEIQDLLRLVHGKRQMSESAVSARTRELRKEKHGHHTVHSRPRQGCTAWEYRVELPAERQEAA